MSAHVEVGLEANVKTHDLAQDELKVEFLPDIWVYCLRCIDRSPP